ncbi:MAG: hypothetical protein HYS27_25585 [Deltaproteobacteria bacterium]|nr:hypothetical protein [Deltaproteobacteria bacterium]
MKIDRSSHLRRALEQVGNNPARLEESLDQLLAQTGATAAELRTLLAQVDQFGGEQGADQRAALEALLDRRQARTVEPAAQGVRAHAVRALKHKPWFLGVTDKPALSSPLFPEPPKDVEVAGEKLAKDELARMLRGVG